MRTDDEIIAEINKLGKIDIVGAGVLDLVHCLPFDKASPFLHPEVTEASWVLDSRDPSAVEARMREYMPFAWKKANERRSLSAMRSMFHFTAWIWLAEDDLGDLIEYQCYGKDNLVKICEYYGWDASKWDDGIREN